MIDILLNKHQTLFFKCGVDILRSLLHSFDGLILRPIVPGAFFMPQHLLASMDNQLTVINQEYSSLNIAEWEGIRTWKR